MGTEIRYRGTIYTETNLEDVRALIAANPGKSRYFLSKELCRLWNWTQATTPKDMVCRGLLLKLHREGLISLPPQKRVLTWLSEKSTSVVSDVDDTPLSGSLSALQPLSLRMMRPALPEERVYKASFKNTTISAIPACR